MINWYLTLSFFLTGWIRAFWGLYLILILLRLPAGWRRAAALSGCTAACVTLLSFFTTRQFYLLGGEILLMILAAQPFLRDSPSYKVSPRSCLFIAFFYELAAGLWDFMVSAGLGVLFRSEDFLNPGSPKYAAAVWIVRLLMSAAALAAIRAREKENSRPSRLAAGISIAGLLGTVFLSGQDVITINDEQLTTWILFSMLIPMAVMFFYLNRQYEMEKKLSQLEKERNALLERDYQSLRNNYAANAKLFHDLHNHLDVLYRYLSKENASEAARYLEDLRSPIRLMTQTSWTGDEAVDYLINSKLALAGSRKLQMRTSIEFPRHTNLLSADLVAILGNLLDNALEAAGNAEESLRFIRLTIRRIHQMLIIKVENGCSAAPVMADGKLQTSKADKSLHGWGLQSVRTAAGHYDGTVETEYSDHVFRTVVTLSFEAVRTEEDA